MKGAFDLVTEADLASEKLVMERLGARFPITRWSPRRAGSTGAPPSIAGISTPSTAPTNFAHGFPVFCVSMGLERAGEPVAGIIFDPLRDEMFTAGRGAGAWLNGARIQVSKAARLAESLVATGFPNRKRHSDINVHFYHQLAMATHGVRRAGSAALDLAYVASGRLDAFWEFGLNSWDMAAGVLMVTEAGGALATCTADRTVFARPMLVDNGLIHAEMLQLFGEVFAGRYRVPLPVVNA